MEHTLAGAAAASGRSKTTLFRAIKAGKLSARRLPDGTFRIDASELARVYPGAVMERPDGAPRNVPVQAKQAETLAPVQAATELAVLRVKLEEAEARIERERRDRDHEREVARDTIAELRDRLAEEAEERRALRRQLAPPAASAPVPVPEPSAGIEELRRRLEESEAHIRALVTAAPPAPQPAQERPGEPSAGVTPAGPLRGLLGRLLGR
jgi:hypothetical protein